MTNELTQTLQCGQQRWFVVYQNIYSSLCSLTYIGLVVVGLQRLVGFLDVALVARQHHNK